MKKRLLLTMVTVAMLGVFALGSSAVIAERADSSSPAFVNTSPAKSTGAQAEQILQDAARERGWEYYDGSNREASYTLDKPEPVASSSGTTTAPVSITHSNFYNKLTHCPTVPMCPNIRGEYTSTSTTLERTGIYRGGVQDDYFVPPDTEITPSLSIVKSNEPYYCPDQCFVTRRYTADIYNKITSVKEAICPRGYVQVGSFNMQDEIVYVENKEYLSYPIRSMDDYGEYLSKYKCESYDSGKIYSGCMASVPVGGEDNVTQHTFNFPMDKAVLADTDQGEAVVKFYIPYPTMTYERSLLTFAYSDCMRSTNSQCEARHAYNLTFSGTFCQMTCQVTKNTSSTKIWCQNQAAVAYRNQFILPYKLQRCYKEPGLNWGENKAPASVVCARQKPVFKKL